MRLSPIFLPLAAIALVSAPALAQDNDTKPAATKAESKAGAYIPFANHGGVWDWHADGTHTVYFQDRHRDWYKAELIGTAIDLPWVQFIGIDASPSDRLDKWSQIYVKGQRYAFKSFERIEGAPPGLKKRDAKKDSKSS